MTSEPHAAPCPTPTPLERMRWFTGRFVTARDLTDEQDYFLRRRWLLNRVLHGAGVLCGMEVLAHPDADCHATTVTVAPGVALDCCGRELVLDRPLCVTWPPPAKPVEREEVLLAVCYHEEPVAPRYAVRDACAASRVREPSRLRECVRWRLLSRDEAAGAWPDGPGTVHDDCADPRRSGCVDPDCAGWVPLAELRRHRGGPIEIRPVHQRVAGAGYLTHVRHVNWPHGGELDLDAIAERQGRLEVAFDRPLRPAGVDAFTFQVEMVGAQRAPELVPYHQVPHVVEDDPTRAVFVIDHDLWADGRRGRGWPRLSGQVVIVTLFCDFILDCHGQPVDGDHLRGTLPSGNGTPGGVFRSWFTVA